MGDENTGEREEHQREDKEISHWYACKVEAKAANKRLSSVDVEEDENKPRKKAKIEGPTEDYSTSYKKPEIKEEVSAKEKALAKSAKGTKNIMSFFGKK